MKVIWYERMRGSWDHGLLMEVFDAHPDIFDQHNEKEWPEGISRAIVIVVGKPEVAPLRKHLETLKSGTVILTSEEDAYFDWEAAIPGHLDIWTQYYYEPNKRGIRTRLLLGAPNRIKDYKINRHLPKKYLWSFVGQVQNPFRQACVDVLKTLPDGFLQVAELFGGNGANGMEYQEYLDIMCQSKFVICPAGSMCVDSFRLYEAMECGAVPITDIRSPRDNSEFNYWQQVCPKMSIATVNKWSDITSKEWTGGYTLDFIWRDLSSQIFDSWEQYKQELKNKLLNAAR